MCHFIHFLTDFFHKNIRIKNPSRIHGDTSIFKLWDNITPDLWTSPSKKLFPVFGASRDITYQEMGVIRAVSGILKFTHMVYPHVALHNDVKDLIIVDIIRHTILFFNKLITILLSQLQDKIS